jgi:hypothetical protein
MLVAAIAMMIAAMAVFRIAILFTIGIWNREY